MTWNRRRRIVVKRGMQLINGLWGENSRSISNWCLPISNDWGCNWQLFEALAQGFFFALTRLSYLISEGEGCLGHHGLVFTPLIDSRSLNFIAFRICLRTCQKKARKKSTRKQIKDIILIFLFSALYKHFYGKSRKKCDIIFMFWFYSFIDFRAPLVTRKFKKSARK